MYVRDTIECEILGVEVMQLLKSIMNENMKISRIIGDEQC